MAKMELKVLAAPKDHKGQPDHKGRKVKMVIRGKMGSQDILLKKEKIILQKTIKKSLLETSLIPFLFGKEANING